LAIDSSLAAEGEGSDKRSPRETLVSSEGDDFEAVRVLWLPVVPVTEMAGRENPVEEVVAVAKKDLFDEEVVESEDRTTMPATGIRTMHRRRLSKPCVPSRR
jgi:hypothetical protein